MKNTNVERSDKGDQFKINSDGNLTCLIHFIMSANASSHLVRGAFGHMKPRMVRCFIKMDKYN